MVIAAAVDTICAIIDTVIAEHDLHKGNTTAVFRKTMTYSPGGGIAQAA